MVVFVAVIYSSVSWFTSLFHLILEEYLLSEVKEGRPNALPFAADILRILVAEFELL